ncbi:hypothetical protein MYX84_10310 [Acidobacteria bacterium AH-259-O06]|nr:hypothetical protein [Acidobacteria bacterium AH-259-O06]
MAKSYNNNIINPLSFLPVMGARLLVFMVLLNCPALAGSPFLKELRPWGTKRGKPFALTLVGRDLGQASKIISTLPASFTPLISPKLMGKDEELPFLVELSADVPVGLYPIRISTPEGLSNILLFSVGVFPEVAEKESEGTVPKAMNNSFAESQFLAIPVTVNGTLRGPDRDIYRFQAKKDERLVLEVEARRAGSALDPVIQLLDFQHKPIAVSNDTPGLGLDCRLDVSFPAEGEYYVLIHDARFSEQERNFYRLKIGSFTYADGLFPLGGQRGKKTVVQLFGGNLPRLTQVLVDLSKVDSKDDFAMISVPGAPGSLPFAFAVGDLPEILEPAGGKAVHLKPSTVVNGRISRPEEVDRYNLAVNPGENWLVELKATELGTSRLFGVLTAYDEKGNKLGSAGDDIPDPDLFALVAPGLTSSDPYLNIEVPQGVNEVLLTVEDLVQGGGPLFNYRLLVRKQPPDFTLTLSTPYVNVPDGGTAFVTVTADRRGYRGSIQLSIQDPGEDLLVEGGIIPPEPDYLESLQVSRLGVLTITAKEGARPRISELSVWGEAVLEEGTVIRRRARGPGLVTAVLGGTGFQDAALRDRQKPFVAPWLGLELPMMVAQEIPAKLIVEGPRQVHLVKGVQYDFSWRFISDNPNIQPPKQIGISAPGAYEILIKRRDPDAKYVKKGVFTISTREGTPANKFNVVLTAQLNIKGSKQQIYSSAMSVEVVQGYEIVVPSEGVTIHLGGQAELIGKVQRDPAFLQPVTIKAENLPPGLSCLPTEVATEEEEFRLTCEARPSAVPGDYTIELNSSSTLTGYDKEKVPYRIPPVEARLIVSGSREVTQRDR